jgi:seryl-tRNA synthetase
LLIDGLHKFQVQAKENADDLVASKKELDAQVEANRKKTKEFEVKMRQLTATVGNVVGKDVPVSQTEVGLSLRSPTLC